MSLLAHRPQADSPVREVCRRRAPVRAWCMGPGSATLRRTWRSRRTRTGRPCSDRGRPEVDLRPHVDSQRSNHNAGPTEPVPPPSVRAGDRGRITRQPVDRGGTRIKDEKLSEPRGARCPGHHALDRRPCSPASRMPSVHARSSVDGGPPVSSSARASMAPHRPMSSSETPIAWPPYQRAWSVRCLRRCSAITSEGVELALSRRLAAGRMSRDRATRVVPPAWPRRRGRRRSARTTTERRQRPTRATRRPGTGRSTDRGRRPRR